MPQLILGLTGQLGSGKGYIASYLRDHYAAEVIKFSGYLSKVLGVMALEQSRDNLIRVSEALRREFGEQTLSFAVARDAVSSSAPLVVIDGIRRVEDVAALEPLPNFVLVAVIASPEIRFARIGRRGEKTDEIGLSWEEFQAQEARSTEVTIPAVMQRASHRIENNGTLDELNAQIEGLLKKLKLTH